MGQGQGFCHQYLEGEPEQPTCKLPIFGLSWGDALLVRARMPKGRCHTPCALACPYFQPYIHSRQPNIQKREPIAQAIPRAFQAAHVVYLWGKAHPR